MNVCSMPLVGMRPETGDFGGVWMVFVNPATRTATDLFVPEREWDDGGTGTRRLARLSLDEQEDARRLRSAVVEIMATWPQT